MRLLLDTHAFIWFVQGAPRVSEAVRTAIEDAENLKFISIASIWEMAIKESIGKLRLDLPLGEFLDRELVGFDVLPISLGHAIALASLPLHHRDPFDRMLAVQSLSDQLPIISRDEILDAYGVQRIWDIVPSA